MFVDSCSRVSTTFFFVARQTGRRVRCHDPRCQMAEIESHESATSSYENYESGGRSSSSWKSVVSWSSDESETRSEDGDYPCHSVS